MQKILHAQDITWKRYYMHKILHAKDTTCTRYYMQKILHAQDITCKRYYMHKILHCVGATSIFFFTPLFAWNLEQPIWNMNQDASRLCGVNVLNRKR